MREESKTIPPVIASDPRGRAFVQTLPSSEPSSSLKELCRERSAHHSSSRREATSLEMEFWMRFLDFPLGGTLNNGDSERLRVPLVIVVVATRPWPLPGISSMVYRWLQISFCISEVLLLLLLLYNDGVLMFVSSTSSVCR